MGLYRSTERPSDLLTVTPWGRKRKDPGSPSSLGVKRYPRARRVHARPLPARHSSLHTATRDTHTTLPAQTRVHSWALRFEHHLKRARRRCGLHAQSQGAGSNLDVSFKRAVFGATLASPPHHLPQATCPRLPLGPKSRVPTQKVLLPRCQCWAEERRGEESTHPRGQARTKSGARTEGTGGSGATWLAKRTAARCQPGCQGCICPPLLPWPPRPCPGGLHGAPARPAPTVPPLRCLRSSRARLHAGTAQPPAPPGAASLPGPGACSPRIPCPRGGLPRQGCRGRRWVQGQPGLGGGCGAGVARCSLWPHARGGCASPARSLGCLSHPPGSQATAFCCAGLGAQSEAVIAAINLQQKNGSGRQLPPGARTDRGSQRRAGLQRVSAGAKTQDGDAELQNTTCTTLQGLALSWEGISYWACSPSSGSAQNVGSGQALIPTAPRVGGKCPLCPRGRAAPPIQRKNLHLSSPFPSTADYLSLLLRHRVGLIPRSLCKQGKARGQQS